MLKPSRSVMVVALSCIFRASPGGASTRPERPLRGGIPRATADAQQPFQRGIEMFARIAASFVLLCGSAISSWAQVTPPPPALTPYQLVDKIEDEWVNRNPVPVRPMLFFPDSTVWAVNPYLSEIVRITASPVTTTRYRTLPGPVSIASYQPSTGNTQLLVVCQHVNAVAIHDAVTGDMLKVIKVRAQPGDLVVDQINRRAWVSCAAADSVMELDLTKTNPESGARVYPLTTSKAPGFLTLYVQSPPVPGDAFNNVRVLVAPRISGNGSLVDRKWVNPALPVNVGSLEINEHAGPLGIRDTLDATVANPPAPGVPGGLPDHDLFWLDPSSGPPTARPLARSMGTLLFANGILPATNKFWQLNLESNNKSRNLQTGGEIAGNIVANRLTRISLPQLVLGTQPALITPSPDLDMSNSIDDDIRSLDDVDTSSGIQLPGANDPLAMGTPYSLALRAYSGANIGFVSGLMTDNLIVLNGNGTRIGAVLLPVGTMPRQVLVSPDGLNLAVWGSGAVGDPADCRVLFYTLSGTQVAAIPVGPDPTPERVRIGRRLFFDASHSLHNNASCASCHDEGKTDMLAWNLSHIDALTLDAPPFSPSGAPDSPPDDDGVDNKGPMITQTLTGISTARPFHWRGEQQQGLADFNEAFSDLLGGDELLGLTFDMDGNALITPNGDFEAFQAFVLSLTEDANQFQHKNRVLSDGIQPPGIAGASAKDGQTLFAQTCMKCHSLPKGTNNEVMDNQFSGEHLGRRLWLKVAPYQGLQFKGMPTVVPVTLLSGQADVDPQDYPAIGTGLAHAGLVPDLRTFMLTMLAGLTQQERDNVTSFVFQFDTGVAQAAHGFVFMNSGNAGAALLSLNQYLLAQASPAIRNCDVAVVGRLSTSPAGNHSGWAYDRISGQFRGEDGSAMTATAFRTDALAGGWFAFAGMPVGTAKKHAIDYDRDEIPNDLEASVTDQTVFDPPSDVPGNPVIIPNGPTVAFQWLTEETGRLTFETNELTTATLSLVCTDPPHRVQLQEDSFKMQHNFVVAELIPSRRPSLTTPSIVIDTIYAVTLTVTDVNGDDTPASWSITTAPQSDAGANPIQGIISPQMDSFITTALSAPTSPNGADVDCMASGTISRRLTFPPDSPGTPMVVIARVFINGEPATAADFVANATNPLNQPFRVGHLPYAAVQPPFVWDETDVLGQFAIAFTLKGTSFAVGDDVVLAIDVAGRSDPIGANPPDLEGETEGPVFQDGATSPIVPSKWSFVETKKALRTVTLTHP